MVAISTPRTASVEIEAHCFDTNPGVESRLVFVDETYIVNIGTIDRLHGGAPDYFSIEVEAPEAEDSLISAERFDAADRDEAVRRFYQRLGEAVWRAAHPE